MEHTGKVLVIDDDAALTELLVLLLGSHGFKVRAATSGQEGLQLARAWQPDVILLDLVMPEMDGWEVCTRLRAFCEAPIIVLSALDSPGFVTRALDTGADDFLTKPVPSNLLVAHINKLLRRSRPQQGRATSLVAPSLPR